MTTQQKTQGINISIMTFYRTDLSNPLEGIFLHSYRIRIENKSEDTVQLINRHWYIFDSNADHYEVKGDGVVGYQPILNPGEYYEYESACELTSEIGSMYGNYTMRILETNKMFKVDIPKFNLIAPMKLN